MDTAKTIDNVGDQLGQVIDKYGLNINALRAGKRPNRGEIKIPVVEGKMVLFGRVDDVACALLGQMQRKIGEAVSTCMDVGALLGGVEPGSTIGQLRLQIAEYYGVCQWLEAIAK